VSAARDRSFWIREPVPQLVGMVGAERGREGTVYAAKVLKRAPWCTKIKIF
jgi:hypothetical protein